MSKKDSKALVVAAKNEVAPMLKSGNDAEIAAKLKTLIDDANSGLRRIIIAGLFIETIATQLDHGQLGPWIKAHCEVQWETVCRWRQLAKNTADAAGIKFDACVKFEIPLHEALALPAAQVPADLKEAREKIDALIEGKSARQLFMQFKSAKLNADGDLEAAKSEGDMVWKAWLEKNHSKLIVNGEAPKRKDVPKEILTAFQLAQAEEVKKKLSPAERKKIANKFAQTLAENNYAATRNKMLLTVDHKELKAARDATAKLLAKLDTLINPKGKK